MNTISDKEIKRFFDQAKQPVPDRGFSRKVMRRLPERERATHPVIVWGFGIVGFLIAILSGGLADFLRYLAQFGREIAQLRMPDYSSLLVYLLVLGAMIGISVSISRKGWS